MKKEQSDAPKEKGDPSFALEDIMGIQIIQDRDRPSYDCLASQKGSGRKMTAAPSPGEVDRVWLAGRNHASRFNI